MISRRTALAGLAASFAGGTACLRANAAEDTSEVSSAPVFLASGPKAEIYGAAENYPIKDPALPFVPGNPLSQKYRVGAFSHFDELFPTRQIKPAASPWSFKRVQMPHAFEKRATDYLSRNPVTGLLIAKDDQIFFEHYQYGRTDRDLLISQSMVKSITGILIGIAIAEGAIKSVDDAAETYVPGFKGTEYGKTPIRDLLHMSSGVEFGEESNGERDLNRLWIDMIASGESSGKGTIGSITQFNRRIAPPGTKFSYASIEPDVLALVLRYAINKPLSDYVHQKIWSRIGAEADAKWLIDAQGLEVGHFGFNAVLRDYARLGRLLAHDGGWEGEQVIPARWMIDATTLRDSDAYLLPGRAMAPQPFGYGYLFWLLPGARRQFALVGGLGQRICVDPASKLVIVQTAVENTPESWRLWSAAVEQFGNA
ncbi:MAG TPA: serine hydrolase [Bradyrhizobium sp.]|uniref:serine hydrolase domain-containing protein n=1 Tax=Bradyrhizobium sp. TaxID=376 RepID=UPI002B47E133|nr:serine hydrolase [Bradyrhizobium sp.]HKO72246.1 serine hydrolase [Bradyrhizobium sp.]